MKAECPPGPGDSVDTYAAYNILSCSSTVLDVSLVPLGDRREAHRFGRLLGS